ncbi:hypothetical protein GQ53DRAFT_265261 [Thozetella sp. PMI_491]|nr:hypothetical protein GQ53DRAFT_265261 [Thozetella sp. PMI_491]
MLSTFSAYAPMIMLVWREGDQSLSMMPISPDQSLPTNTSIASTTITPMSSDSPAFTGIATAAPKASSSLSAGGIAGISIACTVVLMTSLGVLVWFFYVIKYRKHISVSQAEGHPLGPPPPPPPQPEGICVEMPLDSQVWEVPTDEVTRKPVEILGPLGGEGPQYPELSELDSAIVRRS